MTAPLPFLPDDDERTRQDRKLAPPITGAAAASQAYLQGLSGGITVGTAGIFLASFLVALSFHLVVAAGAASVPMPKPQQRVQMEIYKPPPPPPEPEPLPEPEPEPPPKEEPKPKPKPPPKEPPPKETLPPPPSNQEPPPDEVPSEPVPLVTGISMSSTVTNSGGPSVRVGNTTYGDPSKEKFTKPSDVKAYAGGSEDFSPVRTANVSSPATVLREHRPRYPRQLKDQGIEGVVILRVQVTRDGKTRKVKLVKGLHPVLDALSLQSMERFVWKAAQVDGQPVDSIITYRMTWELFD